ALDTIADAVMSLNYRYSHAHTRNSWNFLSNHDLPRLYPRPAGTGNSRNAAALLYAVPGNPVVYYGEEIRLPGMDDPDNRRCMDWNAVASNTSFIDLYRYLNDLRETYKTVFAEGLMAVPYVDKANRILMLERFTDDEALIFIFNFGSRTVSIDAKNILKKTGMADPVDPVTQDPIPPVSALEGFNFKILYFKQG
ncbi:MAG: hypothetical protein GY950_29390, partial [bacterium]|nr:hypothetical protein [bacterium]